MAELDCYVRVSRVSGRSGDSFISPSLQRERCAQHAALHGHTIVVVHEELDVSGGREDRPLWQQMLARVESGDTGGVIVAQLDRFSRSVTGALTAIGRIEAAGGVFVSVGEQFDTTTASGRLMMNLLLAIGQWQRENAAAGFRVARERAVDRGVHVTTRTPFGYVKGKDSRLEIDPVTGPVVAEMFTRRADETPLADIATYLNDSGVVTSLGGRWTSAGVLQMLGNRVYTGEARSGDIVNPAGHPAIVDEETWEAAQLAKRRPGYRQRRTLLAGLLRCAGCRYSLTGGGTRNYYCKRYHGAGVCPEPAQGSQRLLNAYVEERFFDAIEDRPFDLHERDELIAGLRVGLERAERELAAWRDDIGILDTGRDVYVAGLKARADGRDQAQNALARVVAERSAHAAVQMDADTLRGLWPTLDISERRELLAGAIDCIFLRRGRSVPMGQRTHICWRGERPLEMPVPARMGVIVPFDFVADED